jgi:hypothetical protein
MPEKHLNCFNSLPRMLCIHTSMSDWIKTSSVETPTCIHSFFIANDWISTILPAHCSFTESILWQITNSSPTPQWQISYNLGVALHDLGTDKIASGINIWLLRGCGSLWWRMLYASLCWLLDPAFLVTLPSARSIMFVHSCDKKIVLRRHFVRKIQRASRIQFLRQVAYAPPVRSSNRGFRRNGNTFKFLRLCLYQCP